MNNYLISKLNINVVKNNYLLVAVILFLSLSACNGAHKTTEGDTMDTGVSEAIESVMDDSVASVQDNEAVSVNHEANIVMIKRAYEKFVFGGSQADPSDYFTKKALQRLKSEYDYEYDCPDGNCYAYWMLRTDAQDGPEDTSSVVSVDPAEDGWYVVSFKDMGHPGKTRVKIIDGKIDEYRRL